MLEVVLHVLEAEEDVRHMLVRAVMCCVLLVHGRGIHVCLRLEVVLYAQMVESMCRLPFCILEVVKGDLGLLEVLLCEL